MGIEPFWDSNCALGDIEMRGWWALFPLVNIVLFSIDSEKGINRFGTHPKLSDAEKTEASQEGRSNT